MDSTSIISGETVTVDQLTPADWPAVHAIYAEGITGGDATFESEPPPWDLWDREHLAECRLAARRGDRLLGWAALSPVSSRTVYRGVAEVSVYVAAADCGNGVGRLLLSQLIRESESCGLWTLRAGIFEENTASMALHQGLGFRRVGYYERPGCHNGRWRDVVVLERRSSVVGC